MRMKNRLKNKRRRPVSALLLLSFCLAFFGLFSGCTPAETPKTVFSWEEVGQKYRANVVEVYSPGGTGTGFIVKNEGGLVDIVTCLHLFSAPGWVLSKVDDALLSNTHIRFAENLTLSGGEMSLSVLGFDGELDVLALRGALPAGKTGGAFSLAETDVAPADLSMGAEVLSCGNALSQGIAAFEGIVSDPQRVYDAAGGQPVPVFATTAAVYAGASGCPLFDRQGRAAGLGLARQLKTGQDGYEGQAYFALPFKLAYEVYKKAAAQDKNAPVSRANFAVLKNSDDQNRTPFRFRINLVGGHLTVACLADAFVLAESTVSYLPTGKTLSKINGVGADRPYALIASLIAADMTQEETRLFLVAADGGEFDVLLKKN